MIRLKTILAFYSSDFGALWPRFFRAMSDATGGARIVMLSNNRYVDKVAREQLADVVSTVHNFQHLYSEYDREAPRSEIFAEARTIEAKYNCRIGDILQSDRHIGFSYVTGAVYASRFHRHMNYEVAVRIVVSVVRYFEEIFDSEEVDLLFGSRGGSVFQFVASLVAGQRRVSQRILTVANHKEYYYWCDNVYEINERIEKTYHTLTDEDTEGLDPGIRRENYLTVVLNQEADKTYSSFPRFFRHAATQFLRLVYGAARGAIHDRGRTVLGDTRLLWRTYFETQRYQRLAFTPLADLEGVDYVYVPLHYEYELALYVQSPEMNNQTFLVETLAKSVPVGCYVVVKEHYTNVGFRPAGFYRRILQFPNVVMVHAKENPINVMLGARMLATVVGTGATEAALMGVPSITFSKHFKYSFVDHVHHPRSLDELRELLQYCIEDDSEEAVDKRRLAGLRLLAAIQRESIDLGRDYFLLYRDSVIEDGFIEKWASTLVQDLQMQGVR